MINDKLEKVFNKADSATKINIALGFILLTFESGEHRCFYAHESNFSFEKPQILCTKANPKTTQLKVGKFDIAEQYTQDRQNTRGRFKLITNVTIFVA